MSVLKADHISIQFGGLRAVNDFSIDLNLGDISAIIGPNGAGKTTVFNMLTGIYQPTEGKIYVNDKDMSGCKPYQFTAAGLSRTFQNIRLFNRSTVLDNVKMAYTFKMKYSFMDMLTRSKKYHSEEKRVTDEAMNLVANTVSRMVIILRKANCQQKKNITAAVPVSTSGFVLKPST